MHSTFSRAPVRGAARLHLLDRQLRRYCPQYQRAVRALAARHSRLADLALSFPTLLFALAIPRRGLDPACAIGRAIDGAPLAEVAAAVDVPLWLRMLPPEAASRTLVKLRDSPTFRRQIANHLPTPESAPIWLQAVSEMGDLADEKVAAWIAREIARDMQSVNLTRLPLLSVWAWFSRQPETLGYRLIRKHWASDFRFRSALDAADDWKTTIDLHVNLGRNPITELWLLPVRICGYDFEPLTSVSDIAAEAAAMENCLRICGYKLTHNISRLWSMRRNGKRVATLEVAFRDRHPLPDLIDLKGAKNSDAPVEVWRVARHWLHLHDQHPVDPKERQWGSVPLDQPTWTSLWRPYWLAKRRIPKWLPLTPSREALRTL
ncbi:hypothetical protein BH10PSE6_BH10PSE6_31500 [soil metagenome]